MVCNEDQIAKLRLQQRRGITLNYCFFMFLSLRCHEEALLSGSKELIYGRCVEDQIGKTTSARKKAQILIVVAVVV